MSNVRNFGASGDGQADDTEAIQHAVNDGDGLVEFPKGDYRITRPILIDLVAVGRRSLHGLGGVAKIINAGKGPAFFLKASHGRTADPKSFRPEEWQNERMPMVSNLEIEGAHPEADGIRIEGVMQPTLSGVLIRKVHTAVHVTKRARNLIIDQCHFYHNTGIGVHFDQVNLHQAIIGDSHISYNMRGGIRIDGGEIRNFQITGNDIEYNNPKSHVNVTDPDAPTAEIFIDVQEGSVREGTICSNTIQATPSKNGANIRIIGASKENNRQFGLWTISGNMITSQETNIWISAALGVTITGNHLGNADARNLLVEDSDQIVVGSNCFGYHPDYRNTKISTGMKFVNCTNSNISGSVIHGRTENYSGSWDRNALVELIDCKRMNVSGLQVFDGIPGGMYLENCEDTLLSHCMVIDTRDQSRQTPSLKWTGTGKGNLLAQSRLGGEVELADDVTQQGNLQG